MDDALTRDAPAAGAQTRERQIRHWRELRRHAADAVAALSDVPPFTRRHLVELARSLAGRVGVRDETDIKLLAILIHNEAWRETVAGIPFSRRLLLLPHCLRSRKACPAERDEFGLLCEECGRCALGALQREATALGYAVLIAEGSEVSSGMLREGQVDAVIGVSCLAALEQTFARIADEALPAMAVPLLRDGCDTTDVDLETLREHLHLHRPATPPASLSVDAVQTAVQAWFEPEALRSLLGSESSHALDIARTWLAGPGKRWRPLLSASVYDALHEPSADAEPGLIQAVAVAAECFHKASLIHDDIEDNDDFRNGVPTLHRAHGVPIALNAGDLLIGIGYRLLATCAADEAVRLRMLTVAARAHCSLCAGQGDELQWRSRSDVPTSADLMHLFGRKTAPAFEVAILLGAIAGGADAETCAALTDFSRALGIAYQIGDDQQDVAQDTAGDPALGHQPSMMLALLCEQCAVAESREIRNALRDAPRADRTRLLIRAQLERYGVAAAAEALREDYRDRALQALAPIRVIRLKSLLTRLVKRMLPRTERGADVREGPRV
jgi:geranylgeranyl pyrophosphate synthase